MEIVERFPDLPKRFTFDTRWKRFMLGLEAGEFACYTLNDVGMGASSMPARVEVHCYCDKAAVLRIRQDDRALGEFSLGGLKDKVIVGGLRLRSAEKTVIRIEVVSGRAEIDSIVTTME